MSFRIGIDSYSYHRLLGGVRPGEEQAATSLANSVTAVIAEAQRCRAECLALETVLMPDPKQIVPAEVASAANGIELALSWGGAEGFAFGSSASALADLRAWLALGSALEVRLVRVVAGGPRLRGCLDDVRLSQTAAMLRAAAANAEEVGIELALENHADLTTEEMLRLLELTDGLPVGVCLDTANALRVGDDPLQSLEALFPWLRMMHLKDCEADYADAIAGPVSVPYGEGVVPVDVLIRFLCDRSFAGPVCVELGQLGPAVDELELVCESVGWLRERRARWATTVDGSPM